METNVLRFIKELVSLFLNSELWEIDNVLTMISLLFAVFGGGFALKQWVNSNRVRRAEFLDKCIEKIRLSEEFRDAFYLIEYNQQWYSSEYHGSDYEPIIDGFLSYLSYICYLREYRHLTRKDMKILDYYLTRTCRSYSVQSYLWNVYHWSISQRVTCSFEHLIKYGLKHKIINKREFMNIGSKYFINGDLGTPKPE